MNILKFIYCARKTYDRTVKTLIRYCAVVHMKLKKQLNGAIIKHIGYVYHISKLTHCLNLTKSNF